MASKLVAGRAHAAPAGEDAVVGDTELPSLRIEGYFLVKPDCLRVVPSTVAADDGERVRVGGGVVLLLAMLA